MHIREVPQQTSGLFFAVDQMRNSDTIVLRPGGRHPNDIILSGMVGTVSQSAISKTLFTFAEYLLRKSFLKHRAFLSGGEAFDAWNVGARLTIGASSPGEFDLQHAANKDAN